MKKSEQHNEKKEPKMPPRPQEGDENAAPESAGAPEIPQEPMVGLTMGEYNELQEKIIQADQKATEYLDGLQRERADFNNYRKRIERENAQLHQNLTGQIIKKYLVILDDLDRALKAKPSQGEGALWAEGIELIYRKLNAILDAEGVKMIPAQGAMFDPNLHEAISSEDSPDFASGQIIEVLQKGFTINDRVLRPAVVRVAR